MNALNQNLVEFELKPGVRVIVYNTQLTLGKKRRFSQLKNCHHIGSRISSFLLLLKLFWINAKQITEQMWEIPLKKERLGRICDSGRKKEKSYQINAGLLDPHVNKLLFYLQRPW